MTTELVIRIATADDAATLLRFIQELAEYEGEPAAVKTTAETLRAQLSSAKPPFEYGGSYVEFVERTGSEAAGVHR